MPRSRLPPSTGSRTGCRGPRRGDDPGQEVRGKVREQAVDQILRVDACGLRQCRQVDAVDDGTATWSANAWLPL